MKKDGESDKSASLIVQFYSLCDDSVWESVRRKTNMITTDQTCPITQANEGSITTVLFNAVKVIRVQHRLWNTV